MTIATNAFSTYSQVGIKENVSKIITNITPDETPLYSTLSKFTIKDRLYQWQTDSLATPVTTNAQLEGDVVSAAATTATTMLNNRSQISYKSLSVTDTARTVSTYGREDEYDYQVMKRGRELKTDVEVGLLKNSAKDVGSAGTARVCAGLPTYITNVAYGTAPAGTGADTATAGAATALTYAMLSSAITLAYVAGGNPSIMMLPPVLKKKFSALAFSSTPSTADVRYDVKNDRAPAAIGTVDRWLSDFGMIDVVPNRQMARVSDSFTNTAVYLLDPSKARVGVLQDTEVVPLAKRGLADEAFIRIEFTLEVSAPSAHAGIYGVNA